MGIEDRIQGALDGGCGPPRQGERPRRRVYAGRTPEDGTTVAVTSGKAAQLERFKELVVAGEVKMMPYQARWLMQQELKLIAPRRLVAIAEAGQREAVIVGIVDAAAAVDTVEQHGADKQGGSRQVTEGEASDI